MQEQKIPMLLNLNFLKNKSIYISLKYTLLFVCLLVFYMYNPLENLPLIWKRCRYKGLGSQIKTNASPALEAI